MTDSNSHKPLQHYLDPRLPVPHPSGPRRRLRHRPPRSPRMHLPGRGLDHAPAMAKDARTGWIITEYEEGHSISEPSLLPTSSPGVSN